MLSKKIFSLIEKHCTDRNTIFVFPTAAEAQEWFIRALENIPVQTLPKDIFMAWDVFKKNFLTENTALKPISQLERNIFVESIINKNLSLSKKGSPLFLAIIPPEYASTASNFASYLVSVLPQLDNLQRQITKKNFHKTPLISEFLFLKTEYEKFLTVHSLYEPSWFTKEFNAKDKNITLLFPELLNDYYEVREQLQTSDAIEIISSDQLPDENLNAIGFENSLEEIFFTLEKIEDLLTNGVPTNDICITLCNMDEALPYLQREAGIRGIDLAVRSGVSLLKTAAGQLFSNMQQAVQSNFSFDSVKDIFMNTHIPWRNKDIIERLLQFGRDNNCVQSWTENNVLKNCWEQLFLLSENAQDKETYKLQSFFTEFKRCIENIVSAKTFSHLKQSYIFFRDKFLSTEKFSPNDNLIISRCVEQFKQLELVEQEYSAELPRDRFSFFITALTSTQYVAKTHVNAVSVFDFKVMAVSPFKYNFVLGADDKNFSATYNNLSFLRGDERHSLDAIDIDGTKNFALCYANGDNSTVSYAKKTFTDYATCYSGFTDTPISKMADTEKKFLVNNFFQTERRLLQNKRENYALYAAQHAGIKNFFTLMQTNKQKSVSIIKNGSKKIQQLIAEQITQKNYLVNGKPYISQTQLNIFARCRVQFVLQSLLKLQEVQNPQLLNNFYVGILFHGITEKIFKEIVKNDTKINTNNLKSVKLKADEIIKTELSAINTITVILKKAVKIKIRTSIMALLDYLYGMYDGFEIPMVESELQNETDNFILNGKVDCGLQNESKTSFSLFDFKTTAAPSCAASTTTDEHDISDFQMAMYVYLIEHNNPPAQVTESQFWSFIKKEATKIIGSRNCASRELFEPSIDQLLNTAAEFAQAITHAEFQAKKPMAALPCFQCSYKNICRTTFQVEGE